MNRNQKRMAIALALSLAGAGYFGAFSQLDLYPAVKGYLTLIPFQIGTLFYFFCIYRKEHPAGAKPDIQAK